MALCVEVCDNDTVDIGHFGIGLCFWDVLGCWGDGRKEKEVKRLHDVIMSYIAENL